MQKPEDAAIYQLWHWGSVRRRQQLITASFIDILALIVAFGLGPLSNYEVRIAQPQSTRIVTST